MNHSGKEKTFKFIKKLKEKMEEKVLKFPEKIQIQTQL
jgi:hypothetical protein